MENPKIIKRVLAIIVDYKSTEDAAALSLQIAAQEDVNLEILHFDNGNKPEITLSPLQIESQIKYQRSETNLGYAGALNEAVRQARKLGKEFDAYWFLNSDLEMPNSCLKRLIQVLNLHPAVGAVGPRVMDSRKKNKLWGARGKVSPLLGTTSMEDWKGGCLPENSYIPGCSLLIRTNAFEQVGQLPSHYKLYYEETELCIRLQRIGWKLWVERGATIFHKVDSMKAGIPARHFAYYFTRNNLVFWKTVYGIPWWVQMPRTLYVAFREIALPLRRAKNLREFLGRLGYAFAGLWDGVLLALNKKARFENRLFN
jgi:GT2 family glycosyltransferase